MGTATPAAALPSHKMAVKSLYGNPRSKWASAHGWVRDSPLGHQKLNSCVAAPLANTRNRPMQFAGAVSKVTHPRSKYFL